MIRRKLNNEKCGCCCTLKEKLQYLWEHTMGAIKKVNEITPDGDGKFTVEAGDNILLTEISNGLRIETTGGVSYYRAGDSYIDVDNNDLEISLNNPGQTGGVALHDDLEVVATGLTNLLNGGNVGSDVKPIKIVNGVAIAVTNDLVSTSGLQDITGRKTFIQSSATPLVAVKDSRKTNGVTPANQLDTVIQIIDSTNTQIGSFRQVQFPDGAVRMAMNGVSGSNTFALNLQIDSSGNVTLFGEKIVGGVYSTHTIDTW